MGRFRKDENEKAVIYSISIKKSLLDELRKHGSPSRIITELVTRFLSEEKNVKKD
ncbi:hypothetical protein [Schinkia azotoformans]|uniref:hypothetical protein n=1 Tax=Schinkia azotoformans TaxID=1454 RepID=UPI003D274D80